MPCSGTAMLMVASLKKRKGINLGLNSNWCFRSNDKYIFIYLLTGFFAVFKPKSDGREKLNVKKMRLNHIKNAMHFFSALAETGEN